MSERACLATTASGYPCRGKLTGDNLYCASHGGVFVHTPPVVHRCGVKGKGRGKQRWACALRVSKAGERCWLHQKLTVDVDIDTM